MSSSDFIWMFLEPRLFAGFLVMFRIIGLVIMLPGLGSGQGKLPVRALVVAFLAVFAYVSIGMPAIAAPRDIIVFIPSLAREFLVGASLGFFIRMIFAIAEGVGLMAGMTMALSFGNVVDPLTGEQSPAISNLLSLGAAMLFVALGGHHQAIMGLMTNFHMFPIGGETPIGFDLVSLKAMGTGFFAASIKLAAPILIVTTLINVGLGLIARSAPQINVFMVGFTLLMLGGLTMLDASFLGLTEVFEDHISTLPDDMNANLKGMY